MELLWCCRREPSSLYGMSLALIDPPPQYSTYIFPMLPMTQVQWLFWKWRGPSMPRWSHLTSTNLWQLGDNGNVWSWKPHTLKELGQHIQQICGAEKSPTHAAVGSNNSKRELGLCQSQSYLKQQLARITTQSKFHRTFLAMCRPYALRAAVLLPMGSAAITVRATIFVTQASTASFTTVLYSVKIPSRLEPSVIYRSDRKPTDGITMVPWKFGRYSWCGMPPSPQMASQ